jgi:IS30 family transposase
MSYYIQLTQEERYHISVLCKEGFSKTETAKKINRHISTISRELNRNTGKKECVIESGSTQGYYWRDVVWGGVEFFLLCFIAYFKFFFIN